MDMNLGKHDSTQAHLFSTDDISPSPNYGNHKCLQMLPKCLLGEKKSSPVVENHCSTETVRGEKLMAEYSVKAYTEQVAVKGAWFLWLFRAIPSF